MSLVAVFQSKRIIEFGAGTGANAKAILDRYAWIEQYTAIDVPPGTATTLPYQGREVPNVAGHHAEGDPRFDLRLSERGSFDLQPGSLQDYEFAFIDGDHSPEGVRHDTAIAKAAIRYGVICWHDYGRSPARVTEVIDDMNRREGNHICRVTSTSMCFEIRCEHQTRLA